MKKQEKAGEKRMRSREEYYALLEKHKIKNVFKKNVTVHLSQKDKLHRPLNITIAKELPADSFIGGFVNGSDQAGFIASTQGERHFSLLLKEVKPETLKTGNNRPAEDSYLSEQLEHVTFISGNQLVNFSQLSYNGCSFYNNTDSVPALKLIPGVRSVLNSPYDTVVLIFKNKKYFTDISSSLQKDVEIKIYYTRKGHEEYTVVSGISLRALAGEALSYAFSLKEAFKKSRQNDAQFADVKAVQMTFSEIFADAAKNIDIYALPETSRTDLAQLYNQFRHIPVIAELTQNKTGLSCARLPFATPCLQNYNLSYQQRPVLNKGSYSFFAVPSKEFRLWETAQLYLKLCAVQKGVMLEQFASETELIKRIRLSVKSMKLPACRFEDEELVWLYNFPDNKAPVYSKFIASRQLKRHTVEKDLDHIYFSFDFAAKDEAPDDNELFFNEPAKMRWPALAEGDNLAFIGIYADTLLTALYNQPSETEETVNNQTVYNNLNGNGGVQRYKEFFGAWYYYVLGLIITGLEQSGELTYADKVIPEEDKKRRENARFYFSALCHNLPQLLTEESYKWSEPLQITGFLEGRARKPLQEQQEQTAKAETADRDRIFPFIKDIKELAEVYQSGRLAFPHIFRPDQPVESARRIGITLAPLLMGNEISLVQKNSVQIKRQLQALMKELRSSREAAQKLEDFFERMRQSHRAESLMFKESLFSGLDLFVIHHQDAEASVPLDMTFQSLKVLPRLTADKKSYYNQYKIPQNKFCIDPEQNRCLLNFLNIDKNGIKEWRFVVRLYYSCSNDMDCNNISPDISFSDCNGTPLSMLGAVDFGVRKSSADIRHIIDSGHTGQEPVSFHEVRCLEMSFDGPSFRNQFLESSFMEMTLPKTIAAGSLLAVEADLYYNRHNEGVENRDFPYSAILEKIVGSKEELADKLAGYKAFPVSFLDYDDRGGMVYFKIYGKKEFFADNARVFIGFFTLSRELIESFELTSANTEERGDNTCDILLRLSLTHKRDASEMVLFRFSDDTPCDVEKIFLCAALIGYKCPVNYIPGKAGGHYYTTALNRSNTIRVNEGTEPTEITCRGGRVRIIAGRFSQTLVRYAGGAGSVTLCCTGADTETLTLSKINDDLQVIWKDGVADPVKTASERISHPEELYAGKLSQQKQSSALFKNYFSENGRAWEGFEVNIFIQGALYKADYHQGEPILRKSIDFNLIDRSVTPAYYRYNFITTESGRTLEPSPDGTDILAGINNHNSFVNSRKGYDVRMISRGDKAIFNFHYNGNSSVFSSSRSNVVNFYRCDGIKSLFFNRKYAEEATLVFEGGSLSNFNAEGGTLFFKEALTYVNRCLAKVLPDNTAAGKEEIHTAEPDMLNFLLFGNTGESDGEVMLFRTADAEDTKKTFFEITLKKEKNDYCFTLYIFRSSEAGRSASVVQQIRTEYGKARFGLNLSFTESADKWLWSFRLFSSLKQKASPSAHSEKAIDFGQFRRVKTFEADGRVGEIYLSRSPFLPIEAETDGMRKNWSVSDFVGGYNIVCLNDILLMPQSFQLNTRIVTEERELSLYELSTLLNSGENKDTASSLYKTALNNKAFAGYKPKGLLAGRLTDDKTFFYDYFSTGFIESKDKEKKDE
jgi:hypothetical protein